MPDAPIPTPDFRNARMESADELDMTPMVDVTFLLLIFFMVTAAFSLQKSINVPTPEPDQETEQARTIQELESDEDTIIVRVYRDNTIWVAGQQAPSDHDLLVKLREQMSGPGGGASNLIVLADPDARHETVVRALDAGSAAGIESLRLATADEDEF